MAIDFNKKIDLLWKKIGFGVAQTSEAKAPYEESEKSSTNFFSSDIWQEDLSIPVVPSEVPGITELVDIELVLDTTDPTNSTFLAVVNPQLPANNVNRIREFIPFIKSPLYEVQVFSDEARTVRVYPNVSGDEWVFDYSAGVLWFPNGSTYSRLFLSGYRYVGKKGVGPIFTGDTVDVIMQPTSGSYAGGYLDYFISNETKIADAIDGINRAFNDFIPVGPSDISSFRLTIPATSTTFDDSRIVLASGYDENGLVDAPEAGTAIDKLIGTKVETLPFGPFGSGNSGSLSFKHNGAFVSNVTLTGNTNTGTYGYIEVISDVPMPKDFPGFKQGLVVRAVDLLSTNNLNSIEFVHSETGSTNVLHFYRETDLTIPTINEATVTVNEDTVTIEQSSGIPHYGRGTTFSINSSVSDLATNLTLSTKNVEFYTSPVKVGENVYTVPSENGLPAVLEKGEGYDIEGVVFQVEDSDDVTAHGSVRFNAYARNANGYSIFEIPSDINVMRGIERNMEAVPVQEVGIPVVDMGELIEGADLYAQRILLGTGRFPAWTFGSDLPPTWDSLELTPNHEASIVGGEIRFDKNNYLLWLPEGPDYSNKNDVQYATFAIRRAEVSDFIIDVQGKFTGVYVKLPENGDYPYVANGWVSASKRYAGYGVPGKDVQDGCAVGKPAFGGTQQIRVTFGHDNSSMSVNNIILVRFELMAGDAISGLRFIGV